MSGFRTIEQQNNENMIRQMFRGLEDDLALKTVIEVMYGLKDESVLDELREVNEKNRKMIEAKMELTAVDAFGAEGAFGEKSADNVNGNDNGESESDKGHIDAPSQHAE